jgi:guanine deaminase
MNMSEQLHEYFMQRAINLSKQGMESGLGGPFGCVIVRDGDIIAEGSNEIIATNDPTAHAEVVAIRRACSTLGHFQLEDCIIYTSCEPCPMCLGAIYWARPKKVFFANSRADAAGIGFDDDFIYREIALPPNGSRKIPFQQLRMPAALQVFRDWDNKQDKTSY